MLNEYHIKKEFGIIMQKYVFRGKRCSFFDRGAVIGTLYFGGPYILRTTKFFSSFLKKHIAVQEPSKKFGDCRNKGLQNIGCQYNCTPANNCTSYPYTSKIVKNEL